MIVGPMTGGQMQASRACLGHTQSELAKLWGVGERTIRRWEASDPPPLAAIAIQAMLSKKGTEHDR